MKITDTFSGQIGLEAGREDPGDLSGKMKLSQGLKDESDSEKGKRGRRA